MIGDHQLLPEVFPQFDSARSSHDDQGIRASANTGVSVPPETAGSNGIATFRAILGRFRSSSKPEPIGGLDIGLVATSAAQRGGWWRGGTLKCITIRRARAIAFGFSLHDVGTTRRPLLALVALLEVVQSIRARADERRLWIDSVIDRDRQR